MTANVRRSRNCNAKIATSISAKTPCQMMASQRHSAAIAAADARMASLVTWYDLLLRERLDVQHHLALHNEVRQLERHHVDRCHPHGHLRIADPGANDEPRASI